MTITPMGTTATCRCGRPIRVGAHVTPKGRPTYPSWSHTDDLHLNRESSNPFVCDFDAWDAATDYEDYTGGWAQPAGRLRRSRLDRRITRPCVACGRPRTCRWSIDAWVCSACGSEWYPEHGEPYLSPDQLDDVPAPE